MRKTIAAIIIGAYSFLSIFGLVSFHYNSHVGIMMPDCPETVCINVFKDVSSWKEISSNVLPLLEVICLAVLLVSLCFFLTLKNDISKPLFYFYEKTALPNSLYQRLYAQGILNPKVF